MKRVKLEYGSGITITDEAFEQISASNQGLMVMMMLIMSVIVALSTGRQTPLSAPRLTWVPAAGLAQNHSSPEIAR